MSVIPPQEYRKGVIGDGVVKTRVSAPCVKKGGWEIIWNGTAGVVVVVVLVECRSERRKSRRR